MPPDLRDPTHPEEWLRRARSSLALARSHRELPGVLFEDLCFDAQQAAEKGIKAVLVYLQVQFPKTHAVSELLDLVEGAGLAVPPGIREANRLTRYAVTTRYVGLTEDVTEDEYHAAVVLADRILQWAELVATGEAGAGDPER
jgi:HEPN domain-containing protein